MTDVEAKAGVLVETQGSSSFTDHGSLLGVEVPSDEVATLKLVGASTRLTISTVSKIDPSNNSSVLYYNSVTSDKSDKLQGNWIPLCPIRGDGIVTGLNLQCSGDQELHFMVKGDNFSSMFLYGSVGLVHDHPEGSNPEPGAKKRKLNNMIIAIPQDEPAVEPQSPPVEKEEQPFVPIKKKQSKKKKQKKQPEQGEDQENQGPINRNSPEKGVLKEVPKEAQKEATKPQKEATKPLSRKQRKKLAKQKAKELLETVASLNNHPSAPSVTNNGDNKATRTPTGPAPRPESATSKATPASPSFTKPRRIPGGILVSDLVIGHGPIVKAGRKVAILYEGSSNGKVFDKNWNDRSPLVFRQGTGEVIVGLERGLDGMRVGGEREITIPPAMGYGKKGSGSVVPPNATLAFSVKLISVGN